MWVCLVFFFFRLPLHYMKATKMNRYGLVMNIPVQDVNTTSLVYFRYYGYQVLRTIFFWTVSCFLKIGANIQTPGDF